MEKQIEITTYNSSDDEIQTVVPSMVAVCERCNGEGRHTNPSIDGNGITGSEMADLCHDDPDFSENYFGGMYDVSCSECKGLRVVRVIDWDTFEHTMPKLAEVYTKHMLDEACYAAESAAERRMGA